MRAAFIGWLYIQKIVMYDMSTVKQYQVKNKHLGPFLPAF